VNGTEKGSKHPSKLKKREAKSLLLGGRGSWTQEGVEKKGGKKALRDLPLKWKNLRTISAKKKGDKFSITAITIL